MLFNFRLQTWSPKNMIDEKNMLKEIVINTLP